MKDGLHASCPCGVGKRKRLTRIYDAPGQEVASLSPWKRKRPEIYRRGVLSMDINTFEEKFDDHINANIDLDAESKANAIQVSPFVVSLVSRTDTNELFMCSGTIIDSEKVDGTYISTILTSASLIQSSRDIDNIKVDVYLWDQALLDGHVFFYDFHYNLATVRVKSNALLQTVTLGNLDDSLPINPKEILIKKRSQICPGDKVIAIGRYFKELYEIMAACGELSAESCDLDCKELCMSNCKITKCGIGGPLVNRAGEIIGVNFYNEQCTPFLPINIVSACLDYFKRYGRFSRPWLGMDLTNLYMARIDKLEKILLKFPNISKGVLVEEVTLGSPADCAGLLPGDIILKCGKKAVHGVLELLMIILKKAGKSIEVTAIRENTNVSLKLTMHVEVTSPANFYRWPLPEKKKRKIVKYHR